jgi:hypothetical protein
VTKVVLIYALKRANYIHPLRAFQKRTTDSSLGTLEGWNVQGWASIPHDRWKANKEAIKKPTKSPFLLMRPGVISLAEACHSERLLSGARNLLYGTRITGVQSFKRRPNHAITVRSPDSHTRDCALSCAKSGFGIVDKAGNYLKFNAKGNEEALKLLKSTSKKDPSSSKRQWRAGRWRHPRAITEHVIALDQAAVDPAN